MWDEYCRLRKEVKEAVREKKLSIWNEVVEKVNADFEGSRKEFWAFVVRQIKGKYIVCKVSWRYCGGIMRSWVR